MTAALLDHLWQSMLFAAAICLVMPLFRGNSAAVRFWLWFAASVKFLVPLSLFVVAGRHLLVPVTMPVRFLATIQPVAIPFSIKAPALATPAAHHLLILEFAAAAWALGVIVVLARWLLHSLRLRAVLRQATDLPLAAPVPVRSTSSTLEPGLVGIWRPVILLPQGIAERLSPKELDAVLAHELCHLRRRDNLLGALQMLIEALFWFHPLVWWLGSRQVEEREHACDESVLAAGNHPVVYAEGILKVCRFYLQSPLACASGVSGGGLQTRVGAILANRDIREIEAQKCLLLSAMAASLIAMPLLAGAMGSAPVTRLAAQVATVLAAPPAIVSLPAQDEPVGPAKTTQAAGPARHSIIAARVPAREQVNDAAPLVEPQPARQETSALAPPSAAEPAHAPAAPADDSDVLVCRPPQQLPQSRLFGPQVCRTTAVWARYRKDGMDVAADGIHDIRLEKWGAAIPPACRPATAGGGATSAATFTFGMVCF
jgi:beta-lactamase regulating signal transducer with metallopeptidase domain